MRTLPLSTDRSTAGVDLCESDEASFWPWFSWPDFSNWPEKPATVVVLPIVGFADWGLGHAYDLEETLALPILRQASVLFGETRPRRLLVLPPLRFSSGSAPGCAFAVEPPLTHRFIEEIVSGVAEAGFSRVVLYNASPWNEELIDVAARDLRVTRGLQMFCINLSALGFDLHPARSRTRREAQTLATWLTGMEPEPPMSEDRPDEKNWPEEETVSQLAAPASSLAEAALLGPALLERAGKRLASLLGEIASRPALANGGKIRALRA